MDELLKRLAEIRERAAAIKAGEIGDAELEELRALKAEREEIEGKVAKEKEAAALTEELTAESEAEKPAEGGEGDGEGDGAGDGEGEKPAETPATTPAETPATTPAETPGEGDGDGAGETPTPEALAAAAGALGGNDGGLGGNDGGSGVGLTIIASAASFGVQSGEGLIAESWDRIHRIASGAAAGVKQTFGSITRHDGVDALSPRNSAIDNTMLMRKAKMGREDIVALTAAACYCGPNEVDKSIESRGLDERPIAASIRTMPFTGPFDYVRDMDVADVTTGVTLWDCTKQGDVVAATPSTWKPCVTLDCGDSVTVTPYAIPACGLFSTFQQLSHPELVDDFINKLGIAYARLAEQALIDKIRADNTELTYNPAELGLLSQLIGAISHLSSVAGYTRRLRWDGSYTLYVPQGLITAVVADENRRGFSRGANRADIIAQLTALGVANVVEMLDVDTTAEPGLLTAYDSVIDPGNTVALDLCDVPGEWTIHLVPLDSYVRGESTLVEAGFERDTELVRQNMVQYFFEGHEFIEKRTPDVPGWTITLGGIANGGASALVQPESCGLAS